MNSTLVRTLSATLLVVALAACSNVPTPPPSAPSTDVNPISGSRGGSSAGSAR